MRSVSIFSVVAGLALSSAAWAQPELCHVTIQHRIG